MKLLLEKRPVFVALLLVLFLHVIASIFLFLFGTSFLGGTSDALVYHDEAQSVARMLKLGEIAPGSFQQLYPFSVIMGILYALSFSSPIVGILINILFSGITFLLLLWIVRSIGGSPSAQIAWSAFVVSLYPSYLLYSSLFLKDALIIVLAMGGLVLSIQIVQSFSLRNIIVFAAILILLLFLRVYVGFAVFFSFFIAWMLWGCFKTQKRILIGFVFLFLFGFFPLMAGFGYYGAPLFLYYFSSERISFFRNYMYDAEYRSREQERLASNEVYKVLPFGVTRRELSTQVIPDKGAGGGSTLGFKEHSRLRDYFHTMITAMLGPFPWQLKGLQFLILVETIPWIGAFIGAVLGIWRTWNDKDRRYTLLVAMFAAMVLFVAGLFVVNLGGMTRIRIGGFLALSAFVPAGIEEAKRLYSQYHDSLKNFYRKILLQ